MYTNGSVDADSHTAWAAFVASNICQRWRLPDDRSLLQTELVATRDARLYEQYTCQPTVLIHIDSTSAAHAHTRTRHRNNVYFVTSTLVIIYSVYHSHVAVHGNEAADYQTKLATTASFPSVAVAHSPAHTCPCARTHIQATTRSDYEFKYPPYHPCHVVSHGHRISPSQFSVLFPQRCAPPCRCYALIRSTIGTVSHSASTETHPRVCFIICYDI